MDLEKIKDSIVTKVYHIPSDKKVPLHKHPKNDEIFYCIKGEGFGVLEDKEVELTFIYNLYNIKFVYMLITKSNLKDRVLIT